MTALRTRMLQDMQLHGFSRTTQQGYVRSIAKLAKYYHKSPDLISEDDLRQYFLDLTQKQKVSHSTATIDLCAIKFFFETTLHRPWPSLKLMRPPKHQKPRGSLPSSIRDPLSGVSSVLVHDLFLRSALERGRFSQGPGYRQLAHDGAGSGQGLQRKGCSFARTDALFTPRVLADTPFQGVALSGTPSPRRLLPAHQAQERANSLSARGPTK